MPVDPRKRQKKQERRAAKRKAKHHDLVRQKHTGLPERMTAAARYPVLHSCATTDLWDQGLGWVCLSRALPNGQVGFAVFLVDRYCLGVKNAMAEVTDRTTYDNRIVRKMRSEYSSQDLQPAALRKLVEGAVEYARVLGFHPHPDYQKAKLIFGDIDAAESTDQFEFGKDGKPFFISGPNETPERCRQILRTLEQSCGAGGFEYLIGVGGDSKILPESFKDKIRMLGPEEADSFEDEDMDFPEDEDETGGPF